MLQIPVKKLAKRILIAGMLLGMAVPVAYVALKHVAMRSALHVHALFTPEQVAVNITDLFHPDLQGAIQAFVQERTMGGSLLSLDPKAFIQQLQDTFPIIKSVNYRYLPPKTIAFDIQGTQPLCVVNDNFVVGNQLALLDKSFFDAPTLAGLKQIRIDTKLLKIGLPKRVYAFVHKLTDYHWQTFSISYHHPWHIDMTPKLSICHCTVRATDQTAFDRKKLQQINNIFQDLCSRGVVTKKILAAHNSPLIFDTRIKNQIIVQCNHPAKRGTGHG